MNVHNQKWFHIIIKTSTGGIYISNMRYLRIAFLDKSAHTNTKCAIMYVANTLLTYTSEY